MESIVCEDFVLLDINAETKKQVICAIAERFFSKGKIIDLDGYVDAVLQREQIYATAVGNSVAIPHAKTEFAAEAAIGFTRLKQPILWDTEENESADLIFLLAVPEMLKGDFHLKTLAILSRKIAHMSFRDSLRNMRKPAEFIELVDEVDAVLRKEANLC